MIGRPVLEPRTRRFFTAGATAKREDEPQRQSYGLVKGNFVELTEID
jgi:hypothetical protein